jgi:hypothetical protein
VGQTSTHRPQPTHFELSKLTLNLVNLKPATALVIAAPQVFARDDGDCAIFARLLTNSTTDAQHVVHNPGLAINHFKKGIGTIQNALKTTSALFTIYFYCHCLKSQITITKCQGTISKYQITENAQRPENDKMFPV